MNKTWPFNKMQFYVWIYAKTRRCSSFFWSHQAEITKSKYTKNILTGWKRHRWERNWRMQVQRWAKAFCLKHRWSSLTHFKGQGVKNVAVWISSSPSFHLLTSNNVETWCGVNQSRRQKPQSGENESIAIKIVFSRTLLVKYLVHLKETHYRESWQGKKDKFIRERRTLTTQI